MKVFLATLVLTILANDLSASQAQLPQRVLYIGQRASEFVPFLNQHFAKVESVSQSDFKPSQANAFNVVVLDWPQNTSMRGAWLDPSPLGAREQWNKATVLLGSAGLNLAVAWKLKGGSGCTCLAPVAYNLRDHQIFKSPIPIDVNATTNIPTPDSFTPELKTTTIQVIPLVDGIRRYHSVINDYQRGWSTHYYEFADMPDVEVFSGGINEQTPRSAAFWRQGNLLHFGFEQSPSELNATGRAMLVNAIAYISRFTEDRPIDITPSVFGEEKIAVSRNRAYRYLSSFPIEVTNVFSAATLELFNWRDTEAAKAWFESVRPWVHPNPERSLEIDVEAKLLGVPFDSAEFLSKTIAALRDEKTKTGAGTLLARYVFHPLGTNASADEWQKWWQENGAYVFYSELGGYRWYIDPLAKKRGIPTKELRGQARADLTGGGV